MGILLARIIQKPEKTFRRPKDHRYTEIKILVDSVTEKPGHSLSKKDIAILWPPIPAIWTKSVEVVRLCNQLTTPHNAEYCFVTRKMNIYGRGKNRTEVIWCILAELLLYFSMTHPTPLWKISKAQKNKINAEIVPLVGQILQELKKAEQAGPANLASLGG